MSIWVRAAKLLLLGASIAAVALATAACGSSGNSSKTTSSGSGAAKGSPIVIGASVGMTGVNAVYDTQNMAAARMAVKDINAKGGVLGRPLKLVIVDDHSDRAQSGPAALSAFNRGAQFMITQCDFDFGAPAALVAQARKTVALSCAMSPKFGVQDIGPFAYTINYGTNAEGAVDAEYAFKKLNLKAAYALTDTTIAYSKDVCTSFKERFKELAGANGVAGEDTFSNSDASIATQITRLRSKLKSSNPPQFIMLCSYLPGGASAIRQIRAAGINLPIFGAQAMADRSLEAGVPNLSNYYWADYASIYGDDSRKETNDFFAKFKATTGKDATNAYPVMGYSMIEAFAAGIKAAGTTDGDKVRQAFDKFSGEGFIAGPTTYTPQLHITLNRPMAVMKATDGKPKFVTLLTPEKVPAPTF